MTTRDIDNFISFCTQLDSRTGRQAYNITSYKPVIRTILDEYDNEPAVQNHRGHITQAFYVFYDLFSSDNTLLQKKIFVPLQVEQEPELVDNLSRFLLDQSNDCAEYTTSNVRNNLPPALGGNAPEGGGRWSPTFKRIAPLVQYYLM